MTWWAIFSTKTKSLPSSVDIWLFQLIVDTFSLGIRAGNRAGSFREDNLLEESLLVITLKVVGVLGSEPTPSFSLSLKENEDKALEEGLLEVEEVETLLEECFAM